MVEFDSFNFEWASFNGQKSKLIITVEGVSAFSPSVNWQLEAKISDAVKKILNEVS